DGALRLPGRGALGRRCAPRVLAAAAPAPRVLPVCVAVADAVLPEQLPPARDGARRLHADRGAAAARAAPDGAEYDGHGDGALRSAARAPGGPGGGRAAEAGAPGLVPAARGSPGS